MPSVVLRLWLKLCGYTQSLAQECITVLIVGLLGNYDSSKMSYLDFCLIEEDAAGLKRGQMGEQEQFHLTRAGQRAWLKHLAVSYFLCVLKPDPSKDSSFHLRRRTGIMCRREIRCMTRNKSAIYIFRTAGHEFQANHFQPKMIVSEHIKPHYSKRYTTSFLISFLGIG